MKQARFSKIEKLCPIVTQLAKKEVVPIANSDIERAEEIQERVAYNCMLQKIGRRDQIEKANTTCLFESMLHGGNTSPRCYV